MSSLFYFFAKIPLFHHRRIKVSLTLTLLISKLTRSTFINRVRFLNPRLWLTTSQTSRDWPPPPSPRTHTPPPGTFSRLYVLVLCLLVYAILNRDLHDYGSQLWILRCNIHNIHWGERRDSLRFDTSAKYSTKITLFKFLVTKRKTENVGLRFFPKNNNHPTCLYDYLLIHELKFNAARSKVVDLVNFWVLFQVFL